MTEGLAELWAANHPEATRIEAVPKGQPDAAGGSNDTQFWDLSWADDAGPQSQSVVLRLAPTSHPLFPEYDLAIQYGSMREVRELSDVPVPEILAVDDEGAAFGQPCFVMSRIDGRVPPDFPPYAEEGWLFDLPSSEQAAVYRSALDVVARIGRIDVPADRFEVIDRTEYGHRGLGQMLAHQRASLEWAMRGETHPTLEPIRDWLGAHVPEVDAEPGLVWGDARLANLIYDGLEPVAVLDWEMAALGPPEVDLAYFTMMEQYLTVGLGRQPLPGAPDRDQMIEWYEASAGRTISPDFAWFEVFAAYRFGVIMVRILERLVDQGIFPADTDPVAANVPAATAAAAIATI